MDDELARLRERRMQEMKEQMEKKGKASSVDVTNLDETHFTEFVTTNKFVVVDFWAEWCGPCQRVGPAIEELSQEFTGKVAFAKVNTDDNQHLALQFNISAIPAIMLFTNGQLIERIIGAYPKDAIRDKIVRKFGLH
jgi:thioredoxin 1